MRNLLKTLPALVAMAAMMLAVSCAKPCPVCPRVKAPKCPECKAKPKARLTAKTFAVSCDKGVKYITKQVAAHVRLAETLGWYSMTRGERSLKQLFTGKGKLFSRKTLAYLKDCTAEQKDAKKKRAISYLRSYLAMGYIERKTAGLDDKLHAAELGAEVTLSWEKGKVKYRDLPGRLAGEKNAKRRAELRKAMAGVRKTVLNPLLLKKLQRVQELSQWMGYKSYVALSEEARVVKLGGLIKQGAAFMKATQGLFAAVMKKAVKESLKKDFAKMTRADHDALFAAPKVERHLPPVLMLPTMKYFLQGIGLDMKTAAGTQITVDDSLYPLKRFRAACFPLDVPGDIRISIKPKGGLSAWATLFHEGGHALHLANVTEKCWVFQQLGSLSLTEAMAELFARVWEDPAWLKRFAGFVKAAKKGKHSKLIAKKAIRKVPVLKAKDMGYIVRNRLAKNLYYSRRYGHAKLVYESVLFSGPESLWKGSYAGKTNDPKALYQAIFGQAYGYKLSADDGLHWLTDVDAFFYSADYTRAFMLAEMLHEHLRAKFGDDWYAKPAVGAYLKTLWASGHRLTAELAKQLGGTLSYTAMQKRMERLYREAEKLSGRKAPKRIAAGCKPVPRKPGKCKVPW